jgi:tetratricopeptide (TPR) repeat protein
MTATGCDRSNAAPLAGQRVLLVGKWLGMSKRDAQRLVRDSGAIVLDRGDDATLVVIGEREAPGDPAALWDMLDPPLRERATAGALAVISESQLWQRLGLVDREQQIHSLYTPAMLAGLLGESVATIRRWQRRGWIVPTREVRRLAYFDFAEVATAQRLQELLAAGMSLGAVGRALATLGRHLPHVKRPLAELSVVVEGRQLLVRQGDALAEPGGQLRFDFEAADEASLAADAERDAGIVAFVPRALPPATPEEMVQAATELEEQGDAAAAADMLRAAMAAGGPRAELCFALAELLYQVHDLAAARERYYMAIELDEDYVEARANLGCVLFELGEKELAVSAFEGALAFHDDYADVHYHLGRTLDALERASEAVVHWQAFLRLSPSSPWADEARKRLGM